MDRAGQALMLVGIALLLHGAVSSAHYKSLVASRYGSGGAETPLDVLAEVLGGAIAVVLGAVLSGPAFVPIYGSVQSSPLQSVHALFTPRADLAPARGGGAPSPALKGGDAADLDWGGGGKGVALVCIPALGAGVHQGAAAAGVSHPVEMGVAGRQEKALAYFPEASVRSMTSASR